MDKKNNANVADAIRLLSSYSIDDLRRLNRAIIECLNDSAQDKKLELQINELVQFEGKRHEIIRGKLVGKLTKNVQIISVSGARWRVNPNLVKHWDGKLSNGQQWDGVINHLAW